MRLDTVASVTLVLTLCTLPLYGMEETSYRGGIAMSQLEADIRMRKLEAQVQMLHKECVRQNEIIVAHHASMKDIIAVLDTHQLVNNNVEGILMYNGLHWKQLQAEMKDNACKFHAATLEQLNITFPEENEDE